MNIVELRDKRKALYELTEDIVKRAIRFGKFESLCNKTNIEDWYPYPDAKKKSPFEIGENDIFDHYCEFVQYVQDEIKDQVEEFCYEDEEYVSETMDLLEEKYDWINKGMNAMWNAEDLFRDKKIFNGKTFCQIKNELYDKLKFEKECHDEISRKENAG